MNFSAKQRKKLLSPSFFDFISHKVTHKQIVYIYHLTTDCQSSFWFVSNHTSPLILKLLFPGLTQVQNKRIQRAKFAIWIQQVKYLRENNTKDLEFYSLRNIHECAQIVVYETRPMSSVISFLDRSMLSFILPFLLQNTVDKNPYLSWASLGLHPSSPTHQYLAFLQYLLYTPMLWRHHL